MGQSKYLRGHDYVIGHHGALVHIYKFATTVEHGCDLELQSLSPSESVDALEGIKYIQCVLRHILCVLPVDLIFFCYAVCRCNDILVEILIQQKRSVLIHIIGNYSITERNIRRDDILRP